jgi:hypothetical protein
VKNIQINGNNRWKKELDKENKENKSGFHVIIIFKKGNFEFAFISKEPGPIEKDVLWAYTGSNPTFNPRRFEIKSVESLCVLDGKEVATIMNRQQVALDDLKKGAEETSERIRLSKSLHVLLR